METPGFADISAGGCPSKPTYPSTPPRSGAGPLGILDGLILDGVYMSMRARVARLARRLGDIFETHFLGFDPGWGQCSDPLSVVRSGAIWRSRPIGRLAPITGRGHIAPRCGNPIDLVLRYVLVGIATTLEFASAMVIVPAMHFPVPSRWGTPPALGRG